MVLKTSANRSLATAVVALSTLVGLTGCAALNASSGDTKTVVHATASSSPAALAGDLAAITSETIGNDWLEELHAADGKLLLTIVSSVKGKNGVNLVAKDEVSKTIMRASSDAAEKQKFFASVHSALHALSNELDAKTCTRILTTKAGFLAVCAEGVKFDVAVKDGLVQRIYETAADGSGKVVRTQYVYSIGSSAELKALLAAAAK